MQKYLEKFAAMATRNRRVFVFALPFIILFSVFPPAHADAFFWIPIIIGGVILTSLLDIPLLSDIVSDPLLEALMWFANLFITLIATTLGGIYFGIGKLLHAIITYFIAIPVSPSSDALVGFVREAWGFSLLFVNALFILILVFIGLATILRLQSYQLQRTLPLLIAVALLVNFSGVLVGFVVDISNIITNFFLEASVNAAWWTDPFSSFTLNAENLGQNIARILYYIFGTLIYFIVMLLFGVRVIILWTLTILAPLAFAALVLPATKTFWTKWWSNLIQWSIIGIPISFFLYLSGRAVNAQFPPSEGAVAVIVSFFAPLTALFLLFIGITLSMQLAPAGAQGVINFAKKLPKRITETRLGAKAAAWGASKTQGALSRIEPGLKNLGKNADGTPQKGPMGGALRIAGWAGRGIGLGVAAQGANRLAGGKLLEYAAAKRRLTLPKSFDQMSEEELVGSKEEELGGWAKTQNLSDEDLIQLAARMHDKKKYKHTTKLFQGMVDTAKERVSNKKWLQPDIAGLLDAAPETTTEQIFLNIDPSRREEIDDLTAEIEKQEENDRKLKESHDTWRNTTGKTTRDLAAARIYSRELKSGDIANVLNPNSVPFAEGLADGSPENLHRLVGSFDRSKVEDVLNKPGGLNDRSDTREKLIKLARENPQLVKAMLTSPGYQHIALEARRVLRDEFNNRYEDLLEVVTPRPQEPMPLQTEEEREGLENEKKDLEQKEASEIKTIQGKINVLNKKLQAGRVPILEERRPILDEIANLEKELEGLRQGTRQKRIQAITEQLESETRERAMVESMSGTQTQMEKDELIKQYVAVRGGIKEQVERESPLLKALKQNTDTGKLKRIQNLFIRSLAAKISTDTLGSKKISTAQQELFQRVATSQQEAQNAIEAAGGIQTLLENIVEAEKRINGLPPNSTVLHDELTKLSKMNDMLQTLKEHMDRIAIAQAQKGKGRSSA